MLGYSDGRRCCLRSIQCLVDSDLQCNVDGSYYVQSLSFVKLSQKQRGHNDGDAKGKRQIGKEKQEGWRRVCQRRKETANVKTCNVYSNEKCQNESTLKKPVANRRMQHMELEPQHKPETQSRNRHTFPPSLHSLSTLSNLLGVAIPCGPCVSPKEYHHITASSCSASAPSLGGISLLLIASLQHLYRERSSTE